MSWLNHRRTAGCKRCSNWSSTGCWNRSLTSFTISQLIALIFVRKSTQTRSINCAIKSLISLIYRFLSLPAFKGKNGIVAASFHRIRNRIRDFLFLTPTVNNVGFNIVWQLYCKLAVFGT